MLLSRLLPEDRIDWATKRLSDMALSVRRSFLSNGAPVYKTEYGTAINIGEHLHTMYSRLANRREARTSALKRELIKSAIVEKKGK
ncbi:hypothetical protein EON65_02120 [archaeon]|nr:MAG: hypothetical protein EON65_02120 [archaeon]